MTHPQNKLLSLLPRAHLTSLEPRLERVRLVARRTLHHAGTPLEHVYFIEDGLVSVIADAGDGKSLEAWLVGCEGMVGVPVVLGGSMGFHRRVVMASGSALRMSRSDLIRTMSELSSFRDLMYGYINLVLFQSSQAGACNAAHNVQQRLARWLLMACSHDGKGVALTHAVLARLLGVRRATVTDYINKHAEEGVLSSTRGHLVINDREKLEAVSCGCYRMIHAHRERFYRAFEGSNGR